MKKNPRRTIESSKKVRLCTGRGPCFLLYLFLGEGERGLQRFCPPLSPSCLHPSQAPSPRPWVREHSGAAQGVSSGRLLPPSSTLPQPNRPFPVGLPPREWHSGLLPLKYYHPHPLQLFSYNHHNFSRAHMRTCAIFYSTGLIKV